tara:strand:- start:5171 stop:6274 length:1104 start_codon:yes stop_codon:yes gene_type:complete
MFFERIQKQYTNQFPFVAYRQPNASKVLALLQSDDKVYFVEDFMESGFVFAPFDDTEKSILIPFKEADKIECSYTSQSKEPNKKEGASVSENKERHINLVENGIKAINNEEFKKVVLSRQEAVTLSEFNLIQLFKKLLNKYPLAFVYCWYHPKIGLWLGATPETLMKIEGNRFSMMALAGTQEDKGNLNVIWNNKEQEEQQIVTDFIIENLKQYVDNIKTSKTETVKAGNLLHLKTMISANLRPELFKLKDLILSLHPTPAVCGLPKNSAKDFILEHEQYDREFYTGYLGELNFESTLSPRFSRRNIENRAYTITKKSTRLYVNLRCVQIKNNKALIYVGGGITKSSNAEKEWEETVSKSKVIKSIL